MAVIGGLAMLMGLFLLYDLTGTLDMDLIGPAARAAWRTAAVTFACRTALYCGGTASIRFGAKAGCFPLHIWLPKAHPVAPAPASAPVVWNTDEGRRIRNHCDYRGLFFSDGNWGLLLTVLGLVTMLLGALLALLSVNFKEDAGVFVHLSDRIHFNGNRYGSSSFQRGRRKWSGGVGHISSHGQSFAVQTGALSLRRGGVYESA